MGAIGRAARYLARKPGKAALLVLIVFVASLAAMVSVGIIDGASSMASELKAQARPSVGVYLEDGSLVPADVADDLRARRDVSSVNRMGSVDAFPKGFRPVDAAVPDPGWDGAIRINAYDDLSQGSPFESQLLRLTEGRLIEAGDRGVALIHADLAEMNGISVGDEVTLRGAEGEEATATVIGLFSAAGGNEGEQGLATSRTTSFNQVYADCETALSLGMRGYQEVRVEPGDPDGAEGLADSLAEELGAAYSTETFATAYDRLAPSLEASSSTAIAVLALAGATSVAAVTSVLVLWGKGRVRERAVLLSLGEGRAALVGQACAESLAVAALGAALAVAAASATVPVVLRTVLPQGADALPTLAAPFALVAMVALAVPTTASAAVASATAGRNPTELFSERS